MYLCGEDVGELMKRQRGLMGDDARVLGPEPGGYQVFMLTGREMATRYSVRRNATRSDLSCAVRPMAKRPL
jgi:hypothetical protein